MKKLLKAVSLLLIFSFLFALTAACGANSDENNETSSSAESITETTETERTNNVPDELDFDGATFNTTYGMWQGYRFYFFADELNGDIMNDSIYERKCRVEESLNVKLTDDQNEKLEGVVAKVKSSVLANDDTYQMAMLHCILSVADFASGGYLYNWEELPYVDFEADWWNKEQMEALKLGKKTYYGISDFMIPCPYVIFFNKEMAENYLMDDPYQLVYDGTWTVDKFCEMAETAVSDVNGDGTWTIDDSYGISTNEISKYISFMPGADQFITQKNDEGQIELAMNTEKTVDLVEKFAAMKEKNVYYIPKSDQSADQLTLNTGRLMFQLDAISEASNMRDYEVDFGFLPYPKYDETQGNYYSLDWGGLCGIPSTIQNSDMVGAVVELLAFESGETVIPTYYDVVLTGKLARDDDTVNMMDILFDTICYEVGGNYFGFSNGFSDLLYTMGRLAITGNSDFASWYKSKESAAVKTIDNFYKALVATEG